MSLVNANIPGTVSYANECVKSGVYNFDAVSLPVGAGVLVSRANPAGNGYTMIVAQPGLWIDGITVPGSLNTESGIYKVAYPGCDGFLVRTEDTSILIGSNIVVGANGYATAVIPATSHYVVGRASSGVLTHIDCDGNEINVVNVVLFPDSNLVEVAAPLKSGKKENQSIEVK